MPCHAVPHVQVYAVSPLLVEKVLGRLVEIIAVEMLVSSGKWKSLVRMERFTLVFIFSLN